MKKIQTILAMATVIMPLALVSCSKDDPTEPDKKPDPKENPDNPDNPSNPGGTQTTFKVKAGEDLQTVIDKASAGSKVLVQGGVTFTGSFKMRDGVTLSGGWNATFTAADVENNKTILDANGQGRVLDQNQDFEKETLVSGFEIKNGKEDSGAGVYVKKNGIIEECYIHDNEAASSGGGARINAGGIIRNSVITNNVSNNNAGGVYVYGRLENCEVTFNKADNNCGGGAQLHGEGFIVNCTFARNSAKNGGAIRVYGNGGVIVNSLIASNTKSGVGNNGASGISLNGKASVINCSIVSNISSEQVESQLGPGLYFGDGASDSPVVNCVIWGNSYGSDVTGRQIKGNRTAITNCAVAGGDAVDPNVVTLSYTETASEGAAAPDFVSAANNVYRIKSTSALIDKGVNDYAVAYPKDIDGNARLSGSAVDLGCFEYQKN